MNLLELMKTRRSIRKYTSEQVDRDQLEQIVEAGLYAPNAGGGQRTLLVAIQDRDLAETIGRWNAGSMDRSRLVGSYVSADQPSLIDDPSIKSGFYGAPTVCALFGPKNFLYSTPDAYCCAENMALMAANLGLASCIVARGEETFAHPAGQELLRSWEIPEHYIARCFLLLGHRRGENPPPKPRKAGRVRYIP